MPKTPQVNARALLNALKRGGFVVRRQTGSHVILRHPQNGRTAVIPDHPGTISPELIAGILKQAGLSPDEFRELLR